MAKKSSKRIDFDYVVMNFAQLSTAWVSFTIGSTLVALLANLFFPQAVVLGHHALSPVMAAAYAMAIISLIAVGVMPVVEYLAKQNKLELTSTHWMALYWVVNSGSVWLMGRFAEIVGLGVSSWVAAVVLGLVLDLVQGGLMIHVVSKIKSG
jgi:hypothetical protein